MRLLACLGFCLLLSGAALCQTAEAVTAAREQYLAGQHEAALRVLIPAAEAGDAVAQNVLGHAYSFGNGVAPDAVASALWYERAAAQGNLRAVYNLGLLLRDGAPGVAPDPIRAQALFSQAVEGGVAAANAALGTMYWRGAFGAPDIDEAERHFERGRAAGDTSSIAALGIIYRTGDGRPADPARARRYFSEAAGLGVAQASDVIGQMDLNGEGGAPDYDAAIGHFEAAMRGGFYWSAMNAAVTYRDHPNHFGDPVRGYAYCLWALPRASAEERAEWQPHCEAWFPGLTAAERDAAAAIAAGL